MSKTSSSSSNDSPADGRIIAEVPGFYKPHADSYQYAQLGWMFDMFARGEVLRSISKIWSWFFSGSVLSTLRSLDRASHSLEVYASCCCDVRKKSLRGCSFLDCHSTYLTG